MPATASGGSGGGGRRPDHLISADEVPAWLADSVVKTVTYHRTTEASARAIIERGVNLSASRVGAYGQGFYTATASDPFYGPVELTVAIKTHRPLAGSAEEIGAFVDRITRPLGFAGARITARVAARIRRELLRLGYDGIIARDAGGDGIDYVVAIQDGTVKVVVA